MSKSNKVRYKSLGNQFPTIVMTGKIFLKHIDDEFLKENPPQKGDLQIFLSTDSLAYNEYIGNFEAIGLDGYLKGNIFDGRDWKPLSLEEFFDDREYYFGKRERPIDTYNFCLPTLSKLGGTELSRTYREHYRITLPGDKEIKK